MTTTLHRPPVNGAPTGEVREYPTHVPQRFSLWLKVALGMIALLAAALVGGLTATVVIDQSRAGGQPVAAVPSAADVKAANVQLCTSFYGAWEPMRNWEKTLPSEEQKNGTTGLAPWLTTANTLRWSTVSADLASPELKQAVLNVAKGLEERAQAYSGPPEGLSQPRAFVPGSEINPAYEAVYNFCIKSG